MTMTITEALVELKLLDSKINNGINRLNGPLVTEGPARWASGQSDETYKKEAQAALQSTQALIKRRADIRGAIAESNAKVTVTIASQTMTVAEAIQRKADIKFETNLLTKLNALRNSKDQAVKTISVRAEDQYNNFISQRAGSAIDITGDIQTFAESLRAKAQPVIVDPYDNIDVFIVGMNDKLQAFTANVDVQLTISNSVNYISL